MNNKVVSGVGFNNEVRFFIANTKELVQETIVKNASFPIASIALARCASITGIMGIMLKGDQQITTIVDADGPLGKIVSIANSKGETRSLVTNPQFEKELNDQLITVNDAVGTIGNLKVIKDLKMRDPFVSETSIVSGNINMDFTYYFSYSEQVGTAITSGVLFNEDFSVKSAGALIVQLLPNASNDTIDKLEKSMKNLQPIEKLLEKDTINSVLNTLFEGDFKQLDEKNLVYKCVCNEEKFIDGIRLLNEDEIIDIKEDKFVECSCSFCHTVYQIDTRKI